MPTYRQGTISVENGQNKVFGMGTRWLNYIKAGEVITADEQSATILSVDDNDELTLTANWSGTTLVGEKYIVDTVIVEPTIEELKAEALLKVDVMAGEKRAQFITIAPGQEITYMQKLEDAKAYIAAGRPTDASPYLWVDAEASELNMTPSDIADEIIATSEAWVAKGVLIESRRRMVKKNIELPTTTTKAQIIMALALYKTLLDQIT